MTALELTKPTPATLVIRRTYDAAAERVFDAWLSPEGLRAILPSSDETKVLDVAMEARVGGSYRVTWETNEGIWYSGGVYREIVKNERIVCTWTWEEDDPADVQDTLLTLEFHALGPKKTELVLTHTNFRSETSRDNHGDGWSKAVERLAQLLERG